MKIPFILISLVFCAFPSHAQLDSCNVFLKGNYIEVGINWTGAYGSSIPAPSGYHPKGASSERNSSICGATCPGTANCLGFVADPDKDGWTIGSPYPYYGDYFMPGNPMEGWSIMADGNQVNAWNLNSCDPEFDAGLSGQNISYSSYGRVRSGKWQGAFDSLQITQITSLDTNNVFFTTTVSLKNTGHLSRHNIYYVRTLDPDNTQPETGQFATINTIAYQLPNPRNLTLVSAVGLDTDNSRLPNSYLGLGTFDCRAKCFIIKLHTGLSLAPSFGTIDSLFNGFGGLGDTVDYLYSGGDSADVGMGLVYKLGDLAPGTSATFSFVYILRFGDIDSAINTTKPGWIISNDALTYSSGDTAFLCNGSGLSLNIINGGYSAWNWSAAGGSITPATGTSVDLSITSPGLAEITTIGSSGNCLVQDTIKMTVKITDSIPGISISGPVSKASGSLVTVNASLTKAGIYKIEWRKNRKLFDTTTIPLVTYTKTAGNDTINATIVQLGGMCYDSVLSNTIIISNNTGIGQFGIGENQIFIYPNPFNNELNISGLAASDIVSINDVMGRNLEGWFIHSTGSNIFNTSKLLPGIYIIRISDKSGIIKARLPLQKL
jgi:hypothetical protein